MCIKSILRAALADEKKKRSNRQRWQVITPLAGSLPQLRVTQRDVITHEPISERLANDRNLAAPSVTQLVLFVQKSSVRHCWFTD